MMKKIVSIIIPVYNTEKYLDRCFNSVLNQTYVDIEIIAVDDGSKDGSLDIIKNFALKDKRFKYITKNNGGISSAVSAGVEAASGEYVTYIDSDDYVGENLIANYINNIGDYDIIGMGVYWEYADGMRSRAFVEKIYDENEVKILRKNFIKKQELLSGLRWAMMSRLDIVKKGIEIYKALDINDCEDFYYTYILLYYVNSVKIISAINEYYHCLNRDSFTNTVNDISFFEEQIYGLKHASEIIENNLNEKFGYCKYLIFHLGKNHIEKYLNYLPKDLAIKRIKLVLCNNDFYHSCKYILKKGNLIKSTVKFLIYKLRAAKIVYFFAKK